MLNRTKNDKTKDAMVCIPEGIFRMGASFSEVAYLLNDYSGYDTSRYDHETPSHMVYVPTFEIDLFPVTNGQYAEAVEQSVVPAPLLWGHQKWSAPDMPVVGVSWFDASLYAQWRNKSLPTEAEWEKAASWNPQLQSKNRFPWGNQWDRNKCINAELLLGADIGGRIEWQSRFWDSGTALREGKIESVGLRDGDASFYGVRMLSGHVWEWVADVYDARVYKNRPEVTHHPLVTSSDSKDFRTLKGGSWVDDRNSCRCSYKVGSTPYAWLYGPTDVGFRCVRRDVEPTPVVVQRH